MSGTNDEDEGEGRVRTGSGPGGGGVDSGGWAEAAESVRRSWGVEGGPEAGGSAPAPAPPGALPSDDGAADRLLERQEEGYGGAALEHPVEDNERDRS